MANGDNLQGYATVSVIGTGATGVVRVMRYEATGRLIAVKSLAPALVADLEFRDRFRREAAILKVLHHPHIAALLWYVESTGSALIGMELVDGVQLRRLIGEGIATPEAALLVLRGSLDALEYAHLSGVVHRDYKPANVIVDGRGTSRLVDFGLAAGVGEAGIVEGTPAYTAPEQWRGAPATPSTDVYACAAVLHECLTGRVPFDAADHGRLRELHESAPIPLEGVPAALHALLRRGMAKSTAERYPTAGAFLDDLERTASREYGADWAQRGLRALAGLALGAAAFFPLHGVAAAAPSAAGSSSGAGADTPSTPATAAAQQLARAARRGRTRSRLAAITTTVFGAAVVAGVVVGGLAAVHAGPFGSSSTSTVAVLGKATTSIGFSRIADVRGRWQVETAVRSSYFPQVITIAGEDPTTGSISGTATAGSFSATVIGLVSGARVTIHVTQTNGPYVAHFTGSVAQTGDRVTIAGTFNDDGDVKTGTFTATRVAG